MAASEIIFLRTRKFTLPLAFALLVGIGGVAVLMSHSLDLGGAPIDRKGAVALIIAAMSWSVGVGVTRKLPLRPSKVMSSEHKCSWAVPFWPWTAAVLGEFRGFHPQAVSLGGWLSLLYLIVAGSIIGFTAYVWLIHHESPTKVGTYAYVNPVVCGFAGILPGGEALDRRTIIGTLLVLISVW
jgi:drug/metabolite transporter (DMT)-like permease